jgi:PleD family two-component response regulator
VKDVTTPDDLLKKADDAMYEAKAAGKNTYRFSDYRRA